MPAGRAGAGLAVKGAAMTDSPSGGPEGPQAGGPEDLQAWKTEFATRLARGVGHDLRNQLTVIRGYCDLVLAELPADSDLRDSMRHIRSAAERATAITGELLALGRGQMLRPETFDLNEAVAEMRESLVRMTGEDITVSVVADSRPCPVHADRSVLSQALVSLAVNAREAMPGGGELTIRTAAEVAAGTSLPVEGLDPAACVALSVTDTGVGMDEATRQRIFEPFFSTKEPGRGTGLGLSLVRGFAAASGGCVLVESAPGLGSTFTLVLPRARAPAADRAAGGGTILVVEDREEVRQLMVRVLSREGYDVLVAANGPEALNAAERAGAIDLLLTDVVMPKLSGPELAQRLKERRGEMKVLFVTGFADDPACAGVAEALGAAILVKPFSPAVLCFFCGSISNPQSEIRVLSQNSWVRT